MKPEKNFSLIGITGTMEDMLEILPFIIYNKECMNEKKKEKFMKQLKKDIERCHENDYEHVSFLTDEGKDSI